MKKLYVLLPLLFITAFLHAQGLSAGMRGGLGYWMKSKDQSVCSGLEALQGKHMAFVPEMFARYTKGRWAFEAAFNTSTLRYSRHEEIYDAPWHQVTDITDVRNWEAVISVQYDLACPAMKKHPILSRVHNYIGLSIAPVFVKQTNNTYPVETPETSVILSRDYSLQIWSGISQTMTFDLTKRFTLVYAGAIRIRPAEFFSSTIWGSYYNPVAKFGFQIGGSYRL